MIPPANLAIDSISGLTRGEDFINSLVQSFGLLLSIAGIAVLIIAASLDGTAWNIVGVSLYGATLILLYTSSSLYHGVKSAGLKKWFKLIDHSSIYFLIAGTYMPMVFGPFKGALGWSIFGVVWGMAALGIFWKIFHVNRFEVLSTLLYIAMGWVPSFTMVFLSPILPLSAILLMLSGGLAYSLGTIFYLGSGIPFNFVIWHLFVLAGSAFFYFNTLYFMIPQA